MAAYVIVLAKILDRTAFIERYAKPTAALVEAWGGEYLVRAPGAVVIEGAYESGRAVVVSKWEDHQTLDRFWNSPEYQALKAVRADLCECDILVVEAP